MFHFGSGQADVFVRNQWFLQSHVTLPLEINYGMRNCAALRRWCAGTVDFVRGVLCASHSTRKSSRVGEGQRKSGACTALATLHSSEALHTHIQAGVWYRCFYSQQEVRYSRERAVGWLRSWIARKASEERLQAMAARLLDEKLMVDEKLRRPNFCHFFLMAQRRMNRSV